MKKLHTVVALFGAAILSTACAGTNDGHAHQHAAKSTAEHSGMMKKDGMKAPMDHKSHAATSSDGKAKLAQDKNAMAMTDGQVKRINKGAKKITIKHGEITNLDMPPMTMVFRVADDTMLDKVKKGDKVKFHVEDQDGAMVITEIVPAP